MPNTIAGVHLTVDGTTQNVHLFNTESITSLFEELVAALDMQIIHGPVFKEVEVEPEKLTGDVFVDEGGTSAYCMISTSHMSIHCWPLRKQFMMDVFSCKDFDIDTALDLIKNKLAVENSRVMIIDRHFNF